MSGGFKITLDNNTEYIFYYPAGTCTVEEAKQDKASWISAIDDVRNGILG
jgi:thiamine pyrophosphokinase